MGGILTIASEAMVDARKICAPLLSPPAAAIKYPEKQLRRKGVYFRSQFWAVVQHCEGIGCMTLK